MSELNYKARQSLDKILHDQLTDFVDNSPQGWPDNALALTRQSAEKAVIGAALHSHDFNLSKTARCLGIARKTLYTKMRQHELGPSAPGGGKGAISPATRGSGKAHDDLPTLDGIDSPALPAQADISRVACAAKGGAVRKDFSAQDGSDRAVSSAQGESDQIDFSAQDSANHVAFSAQGGANQVASSVQGKSDQIASSSQGGSNQISSSAQVSANHVASSAQVRANHVASSAQGGSDHVASSSQSGGKAQGGGSAAGGGGRAEPMRALISVSDKTGLVELGTRLRAHGIQIIATGGTARMLAEAGVEHQSVEDLTGMAQMMDGRVKTLHPHIFAPILARMPQDAGELHKAHLSCIDIVVVNLYPFADVLADSTSDADRLRENIDIGGVALLRAAAKNHTRVITLCRPAQYSRLLDLLDSGLGADASQKRQWATEAFAHTSEYDRQIHGWLQSLNSSEAGDSVSNAANSHTLSGARQLSTSRDTAHRDNTADRNTETHATATDGGMASLHSTAEAITAAGGGAAGGGASSDASAATGEGAAGGGASSDASAATGEGAAGGGTDASDGLPARYQLDLSEAVELRYGENPHQQARLYRDPRSPAPWRQLQGKQASYNNLIDSDCACALVQRLHKNACVIVKHDTPCAVATGRDARDCFRRAFAADSESAFGGIIAFNCPVDTATAEEITANVFTEIVISPHFDDGSLAVFAAKKNLRLFVSTADHALPAHLSVRRVLSGYLVQQPMDTDVDLTQAGAHDLPAAHDDLRLAWQVVASAHSNAIVAVHGGRTVGICGGATSRVRAVRAALAMTTAFMASNETGDAGSEAGNEAGVPDSGAGDSGNGSGKDGNETAPVGDSPLVLASDAFFPFRDSVDLTAAAGIRAIVQPGGSMRDAEVIASADEHGIAMYTTGKRVFRH